MDQEIFFGQPPHKIYVEAFGQKSPNTCLFIHGGYHSGVCWSLTPDGRPGWGRLAAESGYWSLVTDMPGVGRSGAVDFNQINSKFVIEGYKNLIDGIDGEVTLFVHSLSGYIGFALAELLPEKVRTVVAVEPSLIANVQEKLVPIKETKFEVEVEYRGLPFKLDMSKPGLASDAVVQRFTTQNKPGPTLFPKEDANALKQYLASLQPQHPRLMYELFNIRGTKPPIRDFSRLHKTRILVITTPDDPLHKEDDVKIVTKLRDEGCDVEHWEKGAFGTERNSHMLIIEKNNAEVFGHVLAWLQKGR